LSIIQEAIDQGALPKATSAESLFFGCWSMHHGALIIGQSNIPLDVREFNPVIEILWNNSQKLLDGFNCKALSNTTDSDTMYKQLSSALFED